MTLTPWLASCPKLPPPMLELAVAQVCATPGAAQVRMAMLADVADLTDEQVRRLRDTAAAPPPPALLACADARLLPAAELLQRARLSTASLREDNEALLHVAARHRHEPALLAAIAGRHTSVAVSAALNPACPLPARLAVLDRFLNQPEADVFSTGPGRRLVTGGDRAWARQILNHTASLRVLAQVLARPDLTEDDLRPVLERGLLPSLARLAEDTPERITANLVEVSVVLLTRLGRPALPLLTAWAAAPKTVRLHAVRALADTGVPTLADLPVPVLFAGGWGAELAALAEAAAPVCAAHPDGWALLYRLAPEFTGTVGQLLDQVLPAALAAAA